MGYIGAELQSDYPGQTAAAALVLVVNIARELRARGVIDDGAMDVIFTNAAAVTEPPIGSNLESILFREMEPASRQFQYERRQIEGTPPGGPVRGT